MKLRQCAGVVALEVLLMLGGCTAPAQITPAEVPTTPPVVCIEIPPEIERAEPLPALESSQEPRYKLTDEERALVERMVMAEAGGESDEGQRAVAQCILNAAEHDQIRPDEVFQVYQYARPAESATERVAASVAAVFDNGEIVTEELILWFYAPAHCTSTWHESQRFITEIGGHRFFAEREG